jgi:hypothetical protein
MISGLFASFGASAALVIASAVALSASVASASAAPVKAVATANRTMPTDFSAAKRRHHSSYNHYNYGYDRPSRNLNAYGSYAQPPLAPSYNGSGYPGYGYGYGDNSRNQTW